MTEAPEKTLRERAAELRAALDDAFPVMECMKAMFDGATLEQAAKELTDGHWRRAKLISWNHESLREKTALLVQETGEPESRVREVLMNCSGSLVLTRRKLAGQPILG